MQLIVVSGDYHQTHCCNWSRSLSDGEFSTFVITCGLI